MNTFPIPAGFLESAGLVSPADRELGLPERHAPNRHKRLMVAAQILGGKPRAAIRSAVDLYQHSGLLDVETYPLRQDEIEREVWVLVDRLENFDL